MTDDAPWLDPLERRIWLAWVEFSGRFHQLLDAGTKRAADLRFEDYEVLVHLSQAEDHRLRMTELSRRLLFSQARLTQRITRLTERGLVTREKCPSDRRGTFAVLTDQGWELMVQASPDHVREVRTHLIDLIEPDEREQVAEVLERLLEAARHHQTSEA